MAVVKQVLSSIESHFSALIPHHHDNLVDEILKTHHPDGSQVDVHHLFDIVSRVLLPPQNAEKEAVDTETIWNFFCERMEGIPAESISKLSCEMACNCSGKDAQEKAKDMLKKYLSSYYWDAKIVIILAAFAVNYGQFRLLTESNNPIAKHVALLKHLQGVIRHRASYEKLLGGINELIKATLALTRCVLQFSKYFGTSNLKSAPTVKNVAKAAFYAIHSVLICATHISGLGLEAESRIDVTVTVSTLSTFATQITTFTQELQKHFDICKQDQEGYISVVQFFKDRVANKITILKSLFHDVKSPLVIIRDHVTVEVTWKQLESKKVLLFISSYYPGIEKEIKDLAEAYLERENTIDYRLVWFPINITDAKYFSRMQSLIPWLTVKDLSIIRGGAYRYIEKLWKKSGQKQSILVPLGAPELEESYYTIDWLWSNVLDKIELPKEDRPLPLGSVIGVGLYRPSKPDGSSNGGEPAPIICIFGGEDLKWIQNFVQLTDAINAKFTTINIELVYVSKRESIDEHNKDIFKFLESKSVTYWTSSDTKCRRFWARLEVQFSTAIRSGKTTKQEIVKELLTLLGYNASDKGWAVFGHFDAKKPVKLAKATGDVAELVLKETEKWWKGGSVTDFLQKLTVQLEKTVKTQPHHCCHIMLPATIGDIVREISCPVCDKDMGNFQYYRCCV